MGCETLGCYDTATVILSEAVAESKDLQLGE